MEKKGLTLNRGDLLKFVDQNKNETIEGLFIGTGDNGDFVVVPLSENKSHLSAGKRLRCQCMIKDHVVKFTSEILEVIEHPITLWRIPAPTDAKKYDLRGYKRIQCLVSASIETIHKGQVLTGIIRDISKNGARCIFQPANAAQNPFEVDETVTVRCAFPGIPGEQATLGKIIDVLRSEDELSIGIRFTETAWWAPPYH